MSACESARENIPLLALGLLEEDAEWDLRRHLRGCGLCQRAWASERALLDRVAMAAPLRVPPAALRQRILDVARLDRPEPQVQRSPIVRALIGALTAACLALAALGSWAFTLLTAPSDSVGADAYGAAPVSLALASLQMRDLRPGEVAPLARGWFYLSPESEDGLLVAYQLPQLPDDRAYQLWLVAPDGRISGGLFVVDPEGYGWLKVRAPRALAGYQRIGITIEPRGGSPGPTGPRVLGADL